MQAAKPVPEPQAPLAPYLAIRGAAAALDFYKRAFGAAERLRIGAPGGTVGHAEIEIAGALVMLAEEYPDMNFLSPPRVGGTPVFLHLYVADADAFAARAVAAGATLVEAVTDRFYGDRSGKLADPFGHVWIVSTHKEDLSAAEIEARAAALHGGAS